MVSAVRGGQRPGDRLNFVNTAAPLIAQAIQLRTVPISDDVFYAHADLSKMEIQQVMHSEARHVGVRKIQNIFARKISFGSQAEAGAKTRETLMTTLLTLRKRKPGDVWLNLKTCLNELARDPNRDPYQLHFLSNSS